jgi:lipopolysaccharide/colanic/teichoic acid biosynthesis glycosyltransferase
MIPTSSPCSGRQGIPRWMDILLAASGLLSLSPVVIVVAVLVRVSSRGPVLFRQQRVGRFGRLFMMLKFRTMLVDNAGARITAGGDGRITRVGRLLRKTKLDELPELWNVLVGDMALVGPRPEVPEYVDLTDPMWVRALEYRPGLTDPATLSLRNEEEVLAGHGDGYEAFYRDVMQPYKLQQYVAYAARRTCWTDLHILVKTVLAVLGMERASLIRANIHSR